MGGSIKIPVGIRVLSLMFAMVVAFILTLLVAFDVGGVPPVSPSPTSVASNASNASNASGAPLDSGTTLGTTPSAMPGTTPGTSTAVVESTASDEATGMINDAATPLAGSSATRTGWALLNLVFLGFSLLWSLVLLVGLLRRPRNRESENKRVFGRRDRFIRRLSKGLSGNFNGRIIAAALGAIALLVFVLTENLTLSMAWVDSWSPLMAAFLIAQDAITLRMLARENPAHESLADESPSFSSQQLTPPMPLA